jgi:hypothetical protein
VVGPSSIPSSHTLISTACDRYYDGEVLDFVQNGTNCLQLVVPLTFSGNESIVANDDSSRTEVGPDYPYLATGVVTAVLEPLSWATLSLGFCGLGFLTYLRNRIGSPLAWPSQRHLIRAAILWTIDLSHDDLQIPQHWLQSLSPEAEWSGICATASSDQSHREAVCQLAGFVGGSRINLQRGHQA